MNELANRSGNCRNRTPAIATRGRKLMLLILLLVTLSLGLSTPLLIGIWLPDVFTGSKHILAQERTSDGHEFRVLQYWNDVDFYSTELHIIYPDRSGGVHILDADDSKCWKVPMVVDERTGTVTVTLGGGRIRRVSWR